MMEQKNIINNNSVVALKKRRELLGITNKRKMSLRKQDIKVSECRLEITKITKCVFLGALCLKPMPHLFDSALLLKELDMTAEGLHAADIQVEMVETVAEEVYREVSPDNESTRPIYNTKRRLLKKKCLDPARNKNQNNTDIIVIDAPDLSTTANSQLPSVAPNCQNVVEIDLTQNVTQTSTETLTEIDIESQQCDQQGEGNSPNEVPQNSQYDDVLFVPEVGTPETKLPTVETSPGLETIEISEESHIVAKIIETCKEPIEESEKIPNESLCFATYDNNDKKEETEETQTGPRRSRRFETEVPIIKKNKKKTPEDFIDEDKLREELLTQAKQLFGVEASGNNKKKRNRKTTEGRFEEEDEEEKEDCKMKKVKEELSKRTSKQKEELPDEQPTDEPPITDEEPKLRRSRKKQKAVENELDNIRTTRSKKSLKNTQKPENAPTPATAEPIETSTEVPPKPSSEPSEIDQPQLTTLQNIPLEIEPPLKPERKKEMTPELLLSDSDDDAIDQLMFNIMDIKIEHNLYDKNFFDMPPSDVEDEDIYQSYSSTFNGVIPALQMDKEESKEEKKYVKRTPQCKICSQVFSSYIKLKKHKVQHNGDTPYLCLKCGDNHTTLEQLIAHLRKHEGKRPYVCKKCNEGFKSMEALEKHRPVHILRKPAAPKKTFRCDVCQKEFRKLCDLERHTRVHTGEKPSVCNICNRRFQQAHNLNKHLLIHTQEKPFQCDICSKKFGRNDVLNRHLLTHSVKKPNHCDVCMKSFIRVSQLMAHKEKYHAEKKA